MQSTLSSTLFHAFLQNFSLDNSKCIPTHLITLIASFVWTGFALKTHLGVNYKFNF